MSWICFACLEDVFENCWTDSTLITKYQCASSYLLCHLQWPAAQSHSSINKTVVSWGHNWEPLGLWKTRLSRRNKHHKKFHSQLFRCWNHSTLHIHVWMLDSICTQTDSPVDQFIYWFLSICLIQTPPQLPMHSSQFGFDTCSWLSLHEKRSVGYWTMSFERFLSILVSMHVKGWKCLASKKS